jgi:hypothetical protein
MIGAVGRGPPTWSADLVRTATAGRAALAHFEHARRLL